MFAGLSSKGELPHGEERDRGSRAGPITKEGKLVFGARRTPGRDGCDMAWRSQGAPRQARTWHPRPSPLSLLAGGGAHYFPSQLINLQGAHIPQSRMQRASLERWHQMILPQAGLAAVKPWTTTCFGTPANQVIPGQRKRAPLQPSACPALGEGRVPSLGVGIPAAVSPGSAPAPSAASKMPGVFWGSAGPRHSSWEVSEEGNPAPLFEPNRPEAAGSGLSWSLCPRWFGGSMVFLGLLLSAPSQPGSHSQILLPVHGVAWKSWHRLCVPQFPQL